MITSPVPRRAAAVPALALALVSAACSPPQDDRLAFLPQAPGLDDAMRQAAAASSAVAGIEIAAAGVSAAPLAAPPPETIPPVLRSRVSVDWTGPLGPLVRAMADVIGYDYRETGQAPPVMVSMQVIDRPIWEILRAAGEAAGTRATVVVDVPAERLEMRGGAFDY